MTTDKQKRKEYPLARGVLDYFPDALLEVSHVSHVGNEQHNPGQPLHWAKEKSTDHADCLMRHLVDRGTTDTDGLLHSAKVAWRALAMLQIEIEEGRKQTNFEVNHMGVQEIESTKVDPHKPEDTQRRRIYISGPMRGQPLSNLPAFNAAKKYWIYHGYDVVSPPDLDLTQPMVSNRGFARRDCEELLNCDVIYMLKGWENSIGARAEHAVAKWAELEVIYE